VLGAVINVKLQKTKFKTKRFYDHLDMELTPKAQVSKNNLVLLNHRPVPLKQIIRYMLKKKKKKIVGSEK